MLLSNNENRIERNFSLEKNDDYEEINKDISRILFEMNLKGTEERIPIKNETFFMTNNHKFVDEMTLSKKNNFNTLNCQEKKVTPSDMFKCNYNPIFINKQNLNQTYNLIPKDQNMNYSFNIYDKNLINENKTQKTLKTIKKNKKKLNLDSPRNYIHLDNVIKLKDKRTTLIIRNIPNKYTMKLFTEEINQNFYGKYDVIYLPLDFINKTNLGYAFINFIDPIHIIYFYDEFIGKKWNNFNSEKKCNLAYSKLQGKNELLKYICKKNNPTIITLFGSNNIFYIENNQIICNEIEIPIKYYIPFVNYYPYSLCHKKNDKVFVVDKYFKI